ncbi:hypothetical protein GGI12_003337 [Dipsacomyces acuminosporus]|nr:hypothetical protein GGI12_003337 [Dipsacomyces acuminosporus]
MYGSRYIAERQQDNVMIGRILVSLVWFPLTPIATSWLITILVSVHYYKQKLYPVSEFASIGLLGLQSIFLAIALVVNPYVIDAFKHRHRCNKPELSLHQDVETLRTVSVSVLQIPTESSINSRKTSVPPDHTHDMPPDAV